MSTTVMECTLCLLAVFSLYTVAATWEEEEYIYKSEIRIVDRSFQPEFGDLKSSAYKALNEEMRAKISRLYGNHLGGKHLKRIENVKFSNGSLVVRYKIVLSTNVSATTLAELLAGASLADSLGFRVNRSSVRVIETREQMSTHNAYPFVTHLHKMTTRVTTTASVTSDVTSGYHPTDSDSSTSSHSNTSSHSSTSSHSNTSSTTRAKDVPTLQSGSGETQQFRFTKGCVKTGCLNGGTCITLGDLSWCKCVKWYSGLHCDIGQDLASSFIQSTRSYTKLAVIGGVCLLAFIMLVVGFFFMFHVPVRANICERWRRIQSAKVRPTNDLVHNVLHVDHVSKPVDCLFTIEPVFATSTDTS